MPGNVRVSPPVHGGHSSRRVVSEDREAAAPLGQPEGRGETGGGPEGRGENGGGGRRRDGVWAAGGAGGGRSYALRLTPDQKGATKSTSVRQEVTGTMPGSTSSRPSNKRVNSAS